MPYEYRKLSPKEREHGYPLHALPRPFRGAGSYLISAANFEHRAIMSSPNRRTEFETRLLNSIKEIKEDLIAWVVLPNHYHVLIGIQSLDDMSAALKHLHGTTSREWNIEDNLTGKRRVWYKFADTYIRNDSHFQIAFNYIHYNDRGRDWLQEQWKVYKPPDDFGKG